MIELYNIGISDNTIKNMLEIEPNIKDLSDKEIDEKINILRELNCSNRQIVCILGSNPKLLNRTNGEIMKLIKTLLDYGFDTLNVLFDSNPFILNLESFEINNYIENRKKNGEILEDIIDDLDSNPYLFDEM